MNLAKVTLTLASLPGPLTVHMPVPLAKSLLTSWGRDVSVIQFNGWQRSDDEGHPETYSVANRDISYVRVSWPDVDDATAEMKALQEAHIALDNSPRKEMAESMTINEGLMQAARAAGVELNDA